jgi:3-oxoacyl-[acyl-carrier protein] reductase
MTSDSVAVVTGGGRGIGRGIVEHLAGLGLRLVVNYRADADAAEATCEMARRKGSPEAIAIQADVSELGQGRDLVRASVEHFGHIDCWVNNAGVAPLIRYDLLETTPESWDRAIGNNLRGPFFLTQAVAAAMIEQAHRRVRPPSQILFITSVSSEMASIGRGEYCVAKAGLSMVARLFAVRLAEFGILVNEIRPGIIATEMTSSVKDVYDEKIAGGLVPIRRWGTPDDVGRAVAALVSGAFPFSTGTIFGLDGGLSIPRL